MNLCKCLLVLSFLAVLLSCASSPSQTEPQANQSRVVSDAYSTKEKWEAAGQSLGKRLTVIFLEMNSIFESLDFMDESYGERKSISKSELKKQAMRLINDARLIAVDELYTYMEHGYQKRFIKQSEYQEVLNKKQDVKYAFDTLEIIAEKELYHLYYDRAFWDSFEKMGLMGF